MDKDLISQLMHEVHHIVEKNVASPININRSVGESLRHIGHILQTNSAPYLPIRPEEILVPPQRFYTESDDAIVLISRAINSNNSFTLLIETKTVDGTRTYDLYGFKQDNFNLEKTQFINIDEKVGAEIMRQLNLLITNDGTSLIQCVVLKDHFKNKDVPNDALFTSDIAGEKPAAEQKLPEIEKRTPRQSASLLPPVNDHGLL